MLLGECKGLEEMRQQLTAEIQELKEMSANDEIDAMQYLTEKGKLQDRVLRADRALMDKRKMMLDIEKENIMTIQAALRSIPKQLKKQDESPMAAFLNRRGANA